MELERRKQNFKRPRNFLEKTLLEDSGIGKDRVLGAIYLNIYFISHLMFDTVVDQTNSKMLRTNNITFTE